MQTVRRSLKVCRLRNQNRKQYMNLILENEALHKTKYEVFILSSNGPGASSNVTMKEVLEYPDFPWDWKRLFESENITPLDITQNPHLPWPQDKKLPNYPTITELAEYLGVENNLEAIISDSRGISMVLLSHSQITIKDVLRFPDKNWDMDLLSRNPNITMKERFFTNLTWDWNSVWLNDDMTLQDVLDHPNLPLGLYSLSCTVTLEDILNHPHLPWVWHKVSQNPNITLQMILDHPELPWVWRFVSCNPSVTLNDVLNHPELDWNWSTFSTNRGLRIQDVLDHPELDWDYELMAYNSFDYIFTDR